MHARRHMEYERYPEQRWEDAGENTASRHPPHPNYRGARERRHPPADEDFRADYRRDRDHPAEFDRYGRREFESSERRDEGYAGEGHRANWDYGATQSEAPSARYSGGSEFDRRHQDFEAPQGAHSGWQPRWQGGGYEQGRFVAGRGDSERYRSQQTPSGHGDARRVSQHVMPRRGGEYDYRGEQYSASRSSDYGPSDFGARANYGGAPDYGDRWWGGQSGREARQSPRYGRGPKGYRRSDERIREEICDRMMAATSIDADDIEVGVKSGEVTLSGTVCCRADKFTAEQICAGSLGVSDVNNQLRVKRSTDAGATQRASDAESGVAGADGGNAKPHMRMP